MSTIRHDLRIAARSLAARPAFAIVVVLTLGIGIGVNTAIYSLVDAVMLRPLPFPDSEALVGIWETAQREELELRGVSYPVLEDLSRAEDVFDGVAGIYRTSVNLTGESEPERVVAELVSPAYFPLLGIRPLRGRLLLPADDGPDTNVPAVVLSEDLWERRYGADPDVVGEDVRINEVAAVVVGVVSTRGIVGEAELFLPLRGGSAIESGHTARRFESRGNRWLESIARRRSGVSEAELSLWMERETERLRAEHPRVMERRGVLARPLDEQLVGDVQRTALLLMVSVGMVLAIACANLANLMLARSVGRKREIALRRALGATSFQIGRQLLTETLLLSSLGGAAGILVALWGRDILSSASLFEQLPAYVRLELDGGALGFTALVSVATAVLVGGGPTLAAIRTELAQTLRGDRPPSRSKLASGRGLLVTAQVALALTLAIASGLLLKSLARELEIDPGFQTERRVTLRLQLPDARYSREDAVEFARQVEERLQSIAGVRSVAVGSDLPIADGYSAFMIRTEESLQADPEERYRVYHHEVTPSFFATLGVRLLAGRSFTWQDREDSPLVAVVSRKLAETAWPGQSAVGKRFVIGSADNPMRTVVGVVSDLRYRDLVIDPVAAPDDPDVYLPFAQVPARELAIVAEASSAAPVTELLRHELASLDPGLPVYEVRLLDEILASEVAVSRLASGLLAAFGLVAVALAALGLYGLLAHLVAETSRDLGIRMALGATGRDVVGLVLGRGIALAVLGCLGGLVASLLIGRFLESFLFGVSPRDLETFVVASSLLLAIAAAASYLPARRASRVSPVTLLGPKL